MQKGQLSNIYTIPKKQIYKAEDKKIGEGRVPQLILPNKGAFLFIKEQQKYKEFENTLF